MVLQKVGGEQEAARLPERTNAVAGEYAKAVKQLGEELGIPVVDLWSNIQMQPLWQAYLSDGLHFTSTGNAAVYHLVQAKINEALPQLRYFLCNPVSSHGQHLTLSQSCHSMHMHLR